MATPLAFCRGMSRPVNWYCLIVRHVITCDITFGEQVSRQVMRASSLANVQGQISEHIFAPHGGYCLYYPSNLLRNARSFENWGISSDIPQF